MQYMQYNKNLCYLIFSIWFLSCSQSKTVNPNLAKIKTNKIAVVSATKNVQYQPDSLERAYINYEFFYPSEIRLKPKDIAFILIDSEYVAKYIKDKSVQKLYNDTKILLPNNREQYYQKIIAAIPKEHLLIQKLVWSIKEIREQAENSVGGYLSVCTILSCPNKEYNYYSIEVKRDYYDRLGACLPISFIRFYPKSHKIYIYDVVTATMYSLKNWRKMQ